MAKNRRGRAGEISPARPASEPIPILSQTSGEDAEGPGPIEPEEMKEMTPAYAQRVPTQPAEGVTVVGEAIRRASPESAEFLIEISANAPNAAQAIRDQNNRIAQIAQATQSLNVQRSDIQTISANVYNVYAPVMPA